MADAAVAIDRLEALQIALQLAAKIAFDDDAILADRADDRADLLGRKIFRANVRIDVGLLEDALGGLRADAVDVGQRRFDAFVAGNINSK